MELLREEPEIERKHKEEKNRSFKDQDWKPYQETDTSRNLQEDPDLDLAWSNSFPSCFARKQKQWNGDIEKVGSSNAEAQEVEMEELGSVSFQKTVRRPKPSPSSPAISGLPSRYYQPHLRNRVSSSGFSSPRIPTSSSSSSLKTSSVLAGAEDAIEHNPDLSSESNMDLDLLDERHEGLDWFALYKVSTNWQKGNFLVSELLNVTSKKFGTGPVERTLEVALESEENEKGKGSVREERQLVEDSSTSSSIFQPVVFNPRSSKKRSDSSEDQTGPTRPFTLVQASNSSPLVFTASRASRDDEWESPQVQVYHSESDQSQTSDPNSSRTLTSSLGSILLSQETSSRLAKGEIFGITELRSDSVNGKLGLLQPVGNISQGGKSTVDSPTREGGERLLVCYASKSLSATIIYRIWLNKNMKLDYLEESSFYSKINSPNHCSQIVASALRSPLVVTIRVDFSVSIYRIPSSPSKSLELMHQMKSFSCEWPASFHLENLPIVKGRSSNTSMHLIEDDEMAFRLSISFCTPSYPSSWSISLQEVIIHLPSISNILNKARITTRAAPGIIAYSHSPMEMGFKKKGLMNLEKDSTSGSSWTFQDQGFTQDRDSDYDQEEVGNKILSVSNHEPFIVVGRQDNLLEIYEVYGTTKSVHSFSSKEGAFKETSNQTPLILNHRRVVYGHTGSVQSVALDDGRCISGSSDGSVIVWSLLNNSSTSENRWKGLQDGRSRREEMLYRAGDQSPWLGKRKRTEDCEESETHEEAYIPSNLHSISRVVTLRSPTKSISTSTASNTSSGFAIPTLHDLLLQTRQSQSQSQTNRAPNIRWVGISFDKILSVFQDSNLGEDETGRKERQEQVQIWSFG